MWLAAQAQTGFRMMRAEKSFQYRNILLLKTRMHQFIRTQKVIQRVTPACNTPLIGNDDKLPASVAELAKRIENPGQKFKGLPVAGIVSGVMIDYAIAIEKQNFLHVAKVVNCRCDKTRFQQAPGTAYLCNHTTAMSKEKKPQKNPIDPDKITQHPGLVPFAHHVGSALVRPEDLGKMKSRALGAMEQQTHLQMRQIFEQMEKLAEQAERIRRRVEISHEIYRCKMGFEPIIGHVYHLYEKDNGEKVLSMIGPKEWGGAFPFAQHISTVKMLGDHTWEVLDDPASENEER